MSLASTGRRRSTKLRRVSETIHSARLGRLQDGLHDGETVRVDPGQRVVTYTETVDVDQVPLVPSVSRYVYKRMLDNEPDTALFVLTP
jgi:hypothetical protein